MCRTAQKIIFMSCLLVLATSSVFAQRTKETFFDRAKKGIRSVASTNLVMLPFVVAPEQALPLRKVVLVHDNQKDVKDLGTAVAQYFVQQPGVSILDRKNIRQRNEERLFQEAMSDEAVNWGAEVGASAMIKIELLSIDYEGRDIATDPKKKATSEQIHQSKGFLRAMVQGINLETGEVFGQRSISVTHNAVGTSLTGGPAFKTGIRNNLIDEAALEIAGVFIPLTEHREVPFMRKGRGFNLQATYDAVDSGDIEYARQLAYEAYEDVVNGASGKDRDKAKACYNAGLLLLCEGRYDDAVMALRKANELDRKDLYRETQKLVRDLRRNLDKSKQGGFQIDMRD